jgi:hypothetical protein
VRGPLALAMQESRRLSWYKLWRQIDRAVIVRCPDEQVVDRVWLWCRVSRTPAILVIQWTQCDPNRVSNAERKGLSAKAICHGVAPVGAFKRKKFRHDQCAAWTRTVEICTKKTPQQRGRCGVSRRSRTTRRLSYRGTSPLSLAEDAVAMRWSARPNVRQYLLVEG